MAGLIRGACVTGGWSVEQTQRDAFVARLSDNILSAAFHYSKARLRWLAARARLLRRADAWLPCAQEVGDPGVRAKSIEARAYATAQVASTTTTGSRPHIEGVRIYTREAAKLVQALLTEADALGKAPAEAPAGDAQARGARWRERWRAALSLPPLRALVCTLRTCQPPRALLRPIRAGLPRRRAPRGFDGAALTAARTDQAPRPPLRPCMCLFADARYRSRCRLSFALRSCCRCRATTASSSPRSAPRSCWRRCWRRTRPTPRRAHAPWRASCRLPKPSAPLSRMSALQRSFWPRACAAHALQQLTHAASIRRRRRRVRSFPSVFSLARTPAPVSRPFAFPLSSRPALPCPSPAPQVKLSSKSFGRDAAQVAAAAFASLGARLKHADLSDVLAGRPEAEALEALGILCGALTEAGGVRLESLDLSDNALGEKGVRAAGAALSGQPQLRALTLAADGISPHAAAALGELLPGAPPLRKLHLFNNMTGDEGAAHLAALLRRCAAMEDFRVVSSRVTGAGACAMIDALATGGSLTRLDLCDNGLEAEAGPHLGALLRASPRLEVLLLSECSLADEGVAALCAGLPAAKALTRLELCANDITAEGAGAVAAAIKQLPALRVLRLAENELGDEGAVIIAAALCAAGADAPALEELDVSTNELHSRGAKALAKAAAARRCAKLSLDGNAISDAGVAAVRAILKAGPLGSDAALQSLEDNDADGDDEEDEGDVDLDMSKASL
jgi:Ran GTPase-activating protein (RanGAP) involved in mRNA processing and transport